MSAFGSRPVRGSRIGSSGQVSPAGRGTVKGRCGSEAWLNQSRVWNCSQAPAMTFRLVAGIMSGPRASSAVLTRRGFGVISRGSRTGSVCRGGTLRPKRVPAMPIAGDDRSL
jgi:hypothetical protein